MKNISELIKENSEIVTEKQTKQRKVNLFIMNCGATYTMLNKVQEYIDLLKPNDIYAFNSSKVEKVKDINKFEWGGPHYNKANIVDIICNKYIGEDNFIFIP